MNGRRTRVFAAVVERNGVYMVCQRPPGKRHGGLWEFPGGKLEPGENLAAAARRELEEELCIAAVHVGDAMFIVADEGSEFQIEFAPTQIDGEPVCVEHSDVKWLPLADLPSLALAPSDRRFVEFLLARRAATTSQSSLT